MAHTNTQPITKIKNYKLPSADAFQEFRLRIGIAIGPVIAGVVGASKPTYDIWGDTVNVASRLESSGILGRIQTTEQVAEILSNYGQFETECRGPIEVKGKGKLTTYLVLTPYDCTDSDIELESNIGLDVASAAAAASELHSSDCDDIGWSRSDKQRRA